MINKGNEISVYEKQGHSSLNTESSDDDIRCFADGDSFLAKHSVVLCTLFGHAMYSGPQNPDNSLSYALS